MSFSKRSDAAPVCHSNWNDYFFWVDATAFPLSVPLHKSKTLKKDPFPKPSQYNAEVCDFLHTHTALFWKFPEPFLCWVGISRYYELDENNYPSFLDDNNETGWLFFTSMDLFSFIHHADPTKVRVGEIEKVGDQVLLLEATRGHGAEKEHSSGGGEYVALTKKIIEPVNEDVVEKPSRLKKRKVAGDASGSQKKPPPKKTPKKSVPRNLKEDYGTSGASASINGKSRAAIQSLVDSSKLVAEIGVTAAATVPLVTSSVTPTPEREGGDHTDSVSGPNLGTKPAAVTFVISSYSSHHSGTHAVDVEVSSLVRSTIPDPPIMIAAVTTTVVVETSLVSVFKVTVKPVNPTLFGDSVSTSGHDVAEAEAAEAICLHDHVSTVEATEALHVVDLNLLKERNSTLEAKMRASEEKAAALKSEKSGLTDQVSLLETTCAKLRNQVAAGIEHGKAGRALSDVAAYNPSANADYVAAVNALRDMDFSLLTLLVSQKDDSIADIMDSLCLEGPAAKTLDAGELQPSHEQLMLPIHRPEDNVVLGETSLSFSFKVIHNCIQRIGEDAEARRLSLSNAMVPLIEPLSSVNLLGESSTLEVPVTADVVEDPFSDGIVFEKKELETSHEPAAKS
ncbi:hypothetical protein Tco_0441498 [Tanacetum coccineum]